MTISLQPKTNVSLVGATQAVENTTQRVLFVGQKVAAGTASAGGLVENISTNDEDTLFGANSMLAGMIRSAREQNPITRFDAIPLDDAGAGVAATGSVVFAGTATASGTITITIGSANDYALSVGVTSGDTATVVGDALVTAVTNNTNIPVSASNSTGTVTLTADNDGPLGNFIGISTNGSVAGVTVTLTAFSGGATNPTFTGVFDVVGDNRYQGIVWPYFSDTSEVRSFLEGRFNVDNKVLDGSAFTSSIDTFANHLVRLNALNSQALTDFVDEFINQSDYVAPSQFEMPQIKAAQFAAIRALRLTDGANIGSFVLASNGPNDAFGGPALASKPYFNTPAPDLPLTGTGRGFTETEIEQLFTAGGSVIGNNVAGNGVIFGEVVTTYKTDSAGSPDLSFKFLNYVDTSSNVREYFYNNLRSRFAQSRLTEGDVIRGRDQANALTIRAFCERLYQDLSGPDFVLLEAGEDALVFFKNNLNITIDKANGRVTITMIVPIVTQLREIQATIKIAFSTQS